MSTPTQQPSCTHRRTGDGPACQSCVAAAQAMRVLTSLQPEDQARFQQYFLDPQVQAQIRQEREALESQHRLSSQDTLAYPYTTGNGAVASNNPRNLPLTYPYPRFLPELERIGLNSTHPDLSTAAATGQAVGTRSTPLQSRSTSHNDSRVISGSGTGSRLAGNQSQLRGDRAAYPNQQRAPLRPITGSSAHNARNSEEDMDNEDEEDDSSEDGSNEDDSNEDDDEDDN